VYKFRCSTGVLAIFSVLLATGMAQPAHASCGASFCTHNTDWEAQGAGHDAGMQLDLRYEYILQDQLRNGRDKTGLSVTPGEHDELQTRNQNLVAAFDYNFSSAWGVNVQLPFVMRAHRHLFNGPGGAELESWDFNALGDARLLARYQPGSGADGLRWGVLGGVKLPTGATDVHNRTGETAERSLQPGSGTTDVLAGFHVHQPLEGGATNLFVQALWQQPLAAHAGFEPGARVTLDTGLRYALTLRTSLLLQLNALWKDHDSGVNAEPPDSGGRFLFLSPGLAYAPSSRVRYYGMVQLPLYQYVNGTQLTADWGASVGVSYRF
jgi:hypothetical protein